MAEGAPPESPPVPSLRPSAREVAAAEDVADLAELLERVRAGSGKSLRDLEVWARKNSGTSLPPSTVGVFLRGTRLPSHEKLPVFLLACGVPPEQVAVWQEARARIARLRGRARRRAEPAAAGPERRMAVPPAEVTSFVGRRAELDRVRLLLDRSRMVTLTGPGGVGKSRIAARAATNLARRFADGVCYADLTSLHEPALLPGLVFDALRVGRPERLDTFDALTDYLGDRDLLLVLDNCEHLVEACALLTDVLLRDAPGLRVLTVSRERLGIAGEHVMTVGPLETGDGRRPGDPPSDAAVLFTDRAAAVTEGWQPSGEDAEAVERLCRRLDGLPLAIELAAVHTRAFPLEEIASRIDRVMPSGPHQRGVSARHRTLLASLQWSHDLCTAPQRLLWARMSVLAGDFSLDTVRAVCADESLPYADVAEQVLELVDRSIVVCDGEPGRPRFRLLGVFRDFGRNILVECGETAAAEIQLAQWLTRHAERAATELAGPGQRNWAEWFRRERHQVRNAFEAVCRWGEDEDARAVVSAMVQLMLMQGMVGEARHWAERLMAGRETGWSGAAELSALRGLLALLQGDAQRLELGAAGDQADHDAITGQYLVQGLAALIDDRPAEALDLLERVTESHRTAGRRGLLTELPVVFASVACATLGRTSRGAELAQDVVHRCDLRGDDWGRSYGLLTWSLNLMLDGETAEALSHLRQAVRQLQGLGDALGTSFVLEFAAHCFAMQGHAAIATRLYGVSTQIRGAAGATLFGAGHAVLLEIGERNCRELLGAATFADHYALGAALGVDAAVELLLDEADPTADSPPAHPLPTGPTTAAQGP